MGQFRLFLFTVCSVLIVPAESAASYHRNVKQFNKSSNGTIRRRVKSKGTLAPTPAPSPPTTASPSSKSDSSDSSGLFGEPT